MSARDVPRIDVEVFALPLKDRLVLARALVPECAVVPVKPTNRMCAAGGPEVRKACGLEEGTGNMHTIWAAMIAASEPTR